jgi:hypothetical protein
MGTATAAAADMWTLGVLTAELFFDTRLHEEKLDPLTQLTAMVKLHGEMGEDYVATARRTRARFFNGNQLRALKRDEATKIKHIRHTIEVSATTLISSMRIF